MLRPEVRHIFEWKAYYKLQAWCTDGVRRPGEGIPTQTDLVILTFDLSIVQVFYVWYFVGTALILSSSQIKTVPVIIAGGHRIRLLVDRCRRSNHFVLKQALELLFEDLREIVVMRIISVDP